MGDKVSPRWLIGLAFKFSSRSSRTSGRAGAGSREIFPYFLSLVVLTPLSLNFNLKGKYLLPLFSVSDLPGLEKASSPEASEQGGRRTATVKAPAATWLKLSQPPHLQGQSLAGLVFHTGQRWHVSAQKYKKPPLTPSWGKGDPTHEPGRPSCKGLWGLNRACLFPSRLSTQQEKILDAHFFLSSSPCYT